MSQFPHDQQVVKVKLESFVFNSSLVKFYFPTTLINKCISPTIKLDEWEFLHPAAYVRTYDYWKEISQSNHNRAVIGIAISRVPEFYQTRIMTTLMFIAIMCMLTFYLVSASADRMIGILTIFWVLVQILFLVGDELPKLSYFTRIDTFLNQAMYLTAFVMAAHSFLYIFRHNWHIIFVNEPVTIDIRGEKRIERQIKKKLRQARIKRRRIEQNLSNNKVVHLSKDGLSESDYHMTPLPSRSVVRNDFLKKHVSKFTFSSTDKEKLKTAKNRYSGHVPRNSLIDRLTPSVAQLNKTDEKFVDASPLAPPIISSVNESEPSAIELMRLESANVDYTTEVKETKDLEFTNLKDTVNEVQIPVEPEVTHTLHPMSVAQTPVSRISIPRAGIFGTPSNKYISESENEGKTEEKGNIDTLISGSLSEIPEMVVDYVEWAIKGFNNIRIRRRVDVILLVSGVILFMMLVGYNYLQDYPSIDAYSKMY